MSTSITARVPIIDWTKPIKKHWNNNNPVASHVFNALSFNFPKGEQFFIEAAREVSSLTDLSDTPQLKEDIRLFISQESIHSAQHDQYNTALEKNGYKNIVHGYIDRNIRLAHKFYSPITKLSLASGYEHLTAVLGDYLLSNPKLIELAEPDLKLIWGWHAVEEIEHKSVCFDLYKQAGGGWFRRVFNYFFAVCDFLISFSILFWAMLYKDGLLKPSKLLLTIKQFLAFFYGKNGIMWHLAKDGIKYLSPKFHPWNYDNRSKTTQWLMINKDKLKEV